jgi:predicted nucleotidyltransferase
MNTDANTEKPRLVRIAERLRDHGVEFMVIRGQAAVLLGSPIATLDIDLCYRRTKENLRRLAEALRDLDPKLRGAPPDLPFRLDAESLALGANFTFDTDEGPLDLLGHVEPFGGYEALLPGSELLDAGGVTLRVMGLEDLITVKRHLRRPKDQAPLVQLEAIKRLRDEGKSELG